MDTDLTVEAQARADLAVEIIEQIDDEGLPAGLPKLLHRLFADDYEIAWGRGYDQGHEDGTFAPKVVDFGQPPIVMPPPDGTPLIDAINDRLAAELLDVLFGILPPMTCSECKRQVVLRYDGKQRPFFRWVHENNPLGGLVTHSVPHVLVAAP